MVDVRFKVSKLFKIRTILINTCFILVNKYLIRVFTYKYKYVYIYACVERDMVGEIEEKRRK